MFLSHTHTPKERNVSQCRWTQRFASRPNSRRLKPVQRKEAYLCCPNSPNHMQWNSFHKGTTPIKLARVVYNSATCSTENLSDNSAGLQWQWKPKGFFLSSIVNLTWKSPKTLVPQGPRITRTAPPQDNSWHRATLRSITQSQSWWFKHNGSKQQLVSVCRGATSSSSAVFLFRFILILHK